MKPCIYVLIYVIWHIVCKHISTHFIKTLSLHKLRKMYKQNKNYISKYSFEYLYVREHIYICAQIDYQCNTNTNLFRKTAAGVQNLFLIVALFLLFLLKFIFLCSGSRYFVYMLSLVNKCVLYILVYISCSLTALPFPCCCNHAILVGTYNKINKYLV